MEKLKSTKYDKKDNELRFSMNCRNNTEAEGSLALAEGKFTGTCLIYIFVYYPRPPTPFLGVDVDSKHIYIYETSICGQITRPQQPKGGGGQTLTQ